MGDLVLQLGASNLPSADTMSKSDPFMVLFKVNKKKFRVWQFVDLKIYTFSAPEFP